MFEDKPYTLEDLRPSTEAYGGPSGRLVATVKALTEAQDHRAQLLEALEIIFDTYGHHFALGHHKIVRAALDKEED